MAVDVVARALALQAQSGSGSNYNNLSNLPIINQDLLAANFTPVQNTYYRHTGQTGQVTLSNNGQIQTITLVSGTIYRYYDNHYITVGAETEPQYFVGYYNGEITLADWAQLGEYYYYTVERSTYRLNDASVSEVLVQTDDGYANASYSYVRLPNGDIKFKTNVPTACLYAIVGNL